MKNRILKRVISWAAYCSMGWAAASAAAAAYVPQASIPIPAVAVRGLGSDAVGNLYVLALPEGATSYSIQSYRTPGMEPLMAFETGIATPSAFGVGRSGELSVLEFHGSGYTLTRFDSAGTRLGAVTINPGLYNSPEWFGAAVDAESRRIFFGVRAWRVYFCMQMIGASCPPPEYKGTVYSYGFDGTFLSSAELPGGSGSGGCHTPTAVGGDRGGGYYVGDGDCRRLLKFGADGSLLRDQDASAWSWSFLPAGMWTDDDRSLYISQYLCPPSGCRRGVVKLSESGQVLDQILHDSPVGNAWDSRILYLTDVGGAPLTRLIRNSPASVPAPSAPAGSVAQHPASASLSWQGSSDADGDAVLYRLRLGTAAAATAEIGATDSTRFETATLKFGTTYYWRVVAEDSYLGLPIQRTDSPVASFNLSLVNAPPGNFGVASGTGTAVTRADLVTLAWRAPLDPDGDSVEYELTWRAGAAAPVVLRTTGTAAQFAGLGFGTTHFWTVRAIDIYDAESWLEGGAEQSYLPLFKNSAPVMPAFYRDGDAVYEVHADSVRVRLAWDAATDADGDSVLYRVRLGSDAGSLAVAAAQVGTSFDLGYLPVGSTVYWSVRAQDPYGGLAEGPLGRAEAAFVNDAPASFGVLAGTGTATTRETAALLRWAESADPDGDLVSYTLHLSTDPVSLPTVYSGAASEYLLEGMRFGATYYWSVIARDPYGGLAPNSGGVQSRLHLFRNSAPAAPEILSGTGVSLQHTLSPSARLEWSPVLDPDGDAVRYTLMLNDAAIPLDSATAYNLPSPAFGTTYYWSVRVEDIYGARSETPVQDLRIELDNAPPGAFGPLSGTGTLETRETGAWLSWDPALDPDGDPVVYELALGSEVVRTSTATSYHLAFAYGTTYYWSVAARDGFGGETRLPVQSFLPLFRNAPPPSPGIVSGSGVSRQHTLAPQARLSWSPVDDPDGDAVAYTLYLATVPNGLAPVLVGSGTAYDLPSPRFGTTYYWSVRAEDVYGARSETSRQELLIELDNAPPGAFGPLSGTGTLATREIGARLSWEPARDPDGDTVVYELGLATGSAQPASVQVSTGTSYYLEFTYGTTYQWTVAARDGFGGETKLPVQSFLPIFRNSSPSVPKNLSKTGTLSFHGLSPELAFFWEPATDLDGDPLRYSVEFGTDALNLASLGQVALGHKISGLKTGLAYHYRILAKDSYGGVSDSPTAWVFFEFVNAAPGKFEVAGGTGTLSTRSTSADLSWTAAVDPDGDPVRYAVLAGTSPSALDDIRETDGRSAVLDGLAFGTTYYWTVEALDHLGGRTPVLNGTHALRHEFRNSAPAAPVYAAGIGALAQRTLMPGATVAWAPSLDADGDAVRYELRFGSDPAALPMLLDAATTSRFLPGLAFGTTYYWRAAAYDAYSRSEGALVSLNIGLDNRPPRPIRYLTAASTRTRELSALLSWDDTGDPDGEPVRYRLELGTDAAALEPVPLLSSTSYRLDFVYGTTYFWRVSVEDGFNALSIGELRAFTASFLNDPPETVALSAPFAESPTVETMKDEMELSWKRVQNPQDDPISYSVYLGASPEELHLAAQVGKDAPGDAQLRLLRAASLGPSVALLDAGETVRLRFSGLQFYRRYFLRVEAANPYGAQSSSPLQSFSLTPESGFPRAYAYPVPFSARQGGTRIVFNAPPAGYARARVEIYSELQDLIFARDYGPIPPGVSEAAFDGRDRHGRALFNGSYLCRVRFEAPEHEETFSLLVVR